MAAKELEEIESSLRALLDGVRNAHLAIAQDQGASAIEYANEADRAAQRLRALVDEKPERLQVTARLFIDVLASGVTALKALLEEVESRRAGRDEITAFLLRPLPSTNTLARVGKESS